MKPLLASFAQDSRGASAVEFAFIAPVLLFLYFGCFELTQALTAQRRVGIVAASIGDLVAQSPNVTDTYVSDAFTIGGIIIKPFPKNDLKMTVTSIVTDSKGASKVAWSKASAGNGMTPGAVVSPPAAVIDPGKSVIQSDVSYTYNSPLTFFIRQGVTFKKTFYLRPRKVDAVTNVN